MLIYILQFHRRISVNVIFENIKVNVSIIDGQIQGVHIIDVDYLIFPYKIIEVNSGGWNKPQ